MGMESPKKNERTNIERRLKDLQDLNLDLHNITGRVLDVGAGEDANLVKFIKERSNADIVIGIDPYAKDKNSAYVIPGSAQDIPFADNNFDHVISYASIPNLIIDLYSPDRPDESKEEMARDLGRSFMEMIRVTKPGGSISMAPIIVAENYPIQLARTHAIRKALDIVMNLGHDYNLEFLRREIDPVNKEESKIFRLTIIKK